MYNALTHLRTPAIPTRNEVLELNIEHQESRLQQARKDQNWDLVSYLHSDIYRMKFELKHPTLYN